MSQDFSMPKIPEMSKAELDEVLQRGELGKISFESIRTLNIAALTATCLVEDTKQYRENRKTLRHQIVLGHISKCVKLNMSILELDSNSKYGETIEILINQIHVASVRGLYFLNCDEQKLIGFAKKSLLPYAGQYQTAKEKLSESKNAEVFIGFCESMADAAGLVMADISESDFVMPTVEEILRDLNLTETSLAQYCMASFSAIKNDFTFISKNLISECDGNYFIHDKSKRVSPLVLSTSGVGLSSLLASYCEKFLTYPEAIHSFKEYFDKLHTWFKFLSEYCLSAHLPDHKIEPIEKKSPRVSKIEDHQYQKKRLIPPLMKIGNMKLQSWSNDRMPEILWALLIIESYGRDKALPLFRRLINYYGNNRHLEGDVTFSGIAKLDVKSKFEIISLITFEGKAKEALAPLMLLKSIPGLEFWKPFIPAVSDEKVILNKLAKAVFLGLDQAGDEATVGRWLRVAAKTAIGKMVFPSEDHYRRIFEYPDFGDRNMTESSIRATEGALDGITEIGKPAWIDTFWDECFRISTCHRIDRGLPTQIETYKQINPQILWKIYNDISDKYLELLPTTTVEAKHDCLWGTTLFILQVASDIISSPANSLLTLLGVRTCVEGIINLKYLLKKNDPELWKKFRDYGIGQAKLNVLKLREQNNHPRYIPFDAIEKIANEDRWEEYTVVDVGDWSSDNLRKRADGAELKELYDQYYCWPSCFAHAQWAAIRYTVFDNCVNPLHRLHRIAVPSTNIPTVKYDVEILLDNLFTIISQEYNSEALLFKNLISKFNEKGSEEVNPDEHIK